MNCVQCFISIREPHTKINQDPKMPEAASAGISKGDVHGLVIQF